MRTIDVLILDNHVVLDSTIGEAVCGTVSAPFPANDLFVLLAVQAVSFVLAAKPSPYVGAGLSTVPDTVILP